MRPRPPSSMSMALPLGERKVKSHPLLQGAWLCGWAVESDSVYPRAARDGYSFSLPLLLPSLPLLLPPLFFLHLSFLPTLFSHPLTLHSSTPPSPPRYFQWQVDSFESRMAQFSRQIHELESQLKSSHCDQALDPSCEGGVLV